MNVGAGPADAKRTRRRLWILAIVGLVVVVAVLAGVRVLQIRSMIKAGEGFAIPPETVSSAKVEAAQWQASRSAVATLVAFRGVTVASEVPGLVRRIAFESGGYVKKGDVLVELDAVTDAAQLSAARAEAELARASLERAKALRAANSISAADLETAQARAQQASANAAALSAGLAKKTIRAPFEGRLGIREIELGQVVSPGAAVVSLQAMHPIHADFWLPQQVLSELKAGLQVKLRTDVFPGASWDGVLTVVNPEVDPSTRNVRARATFPNPDGRLRPGMFVNVETLSKDKRDVLVIPATAVVYAPFGDSVFAIEQKKDPKGKEALTAVQKFVRLGMRRGDFVEVSQGLQAGETIVSSGAFKLRNGMAVVVKNELAPDVQQAPRPLDR